MREMGRPELHPKASIGRTFIRACAPELVNEIPLPIATLAPPPVHVWTKQDLLTKCCAGRVLEAEAAVELHYIHPW